MRLGALRNEVFEVAYLDFGLHLLRDGVERLEEGTIDRAAVYPRRVVEAYAAGVPVVASRIGALSEVVEDAVTGLLAEPGDPASWAAAIERLRNDEASVRLGEGAYRTWAERYTPEKNLRRLEEIYREVAGAMG